MDCFWAEVVSGHLELKEAEAARWLSADQLDEVKWLPADRELIEPIRQTLAKRKTLDYYEKNAESFVTGTQDVRFEDTQKRFASLLPDGAYILDFGCGSGRDAKAFLDMGYRVDAIDGSEKLCELASENVGITVRKMLFSELDECGKYDGIWACASILHLPKEELKSVFGKMLRAVKSGGYIYTSFKYGDFEGCRNDRYFTDFTEDSFGRFISGITEIRIIDNWVTSDVRPGRGDEKWLNLILKKSDTV
ncbi:MAG: methyltransferase domain-containing protein [Lachnospiraceae bacterium]|nr:methyltransferase domain-containing protein [Lachnospiraceae bacterium]